MKDHFLRLNYYSIFLAIQIFLIVLAISGYKEHTAFFWFVMITSPLCILCYVVNIIDALKGLNND